MSAISISSPFPTFTDVDGDPLESGYIYVGQANVDPVTFPIAVYWDVALTIPAAQPIRTIGGYPARNGSPARIYANSDYSIRVNNKNGSLVYSSPAATDRLDSWQVGYDGGTVQDVLDAVTGPNGAASIGYTPAGTDAVATTVESKLQQTVSVFDFMTAAQIADIKSNAASVDVTDEIQAAIDWASTQGHFVSFASPMAIIGLEFPAGRYLISQTLRMATNAAFCNLIGQDGAELVYTGTGACLHIGNNSTNGIMPVHIKNLNFFRANNDAGTIGLWVQGASNGYYEGLSVQGFEKGIFNDGSINCLYDFKRRTIRGSRFGFVATSLSPVPSGLRYANNLLTVRNCSFSGGVQDAFTYMPGAGHVSGGGLATLDYCTFEGVTGNSIYIEKNGEVLGLDRFVVSNCWFESYGTSAASLTSARVLFKNCFIAGASGECVILNDADCDVVFEQFHGYFADSAPASGTIVKSAIGATNLAGQCKFIDCDWTGTVKSTPWLGQISKTDPLTKSKHIKLNSGYPSGNNSYNWNLALDLYTVFTDLFGTLPVDGRVFVDFSIFGTDGGAIGSAQYRLYYQDSAGTPVKTLSTIIAGSGITVAETTITFPGGGGTWYNASMHVQATYLNT